MYRKNPWQAYKQAAAQTATPGQLVLMLYDGTLKFLNSALAAFESEDPLMFNQTISNNILKAQAIIDELSLALDMDAGGEFSDKMRALYDYMDRRLQEANLSKSPEGIDEVIRHITILRDAWKEMLESGGTDQSVVEFENGVEPRLASK